MDVDYIVCVCACECEFVLFTCNVYRFGRSWLDLFFFSSLSCAYIICSYCTYMFMYLHRMPRKMKNKKLKESMYIML